MIWESSVFIIHNSKMYEKLKVEWIKKQQNTHGSGKESFKYAVIFPLFNSCS